VREVDNLEQRLEALLVQDDLPIQRKAKKRKGRRRRKPGKAFRTINAREHIVSLSMNLPEGFTEKSGWTAFYADLCRIGERGLRTSELLGLLNIEKKNSLVIRLRTQFRVKEGYESPLHV